MGQTSQERAEHGKLRCGHRRFCLSRLSRSPGPCSNDGPLRWRFLKTILPRVREPCARVNARELFTQTAPRPFGRCDQCPLQDRRHHSFTHMLSDIHLRFHGLFYLVHKDRTLVLGTLGCEQGSVSFFESLAGVLRTPSIRLNCSAEPEHVKITLAHAQPPCDFDAPWTSLKYAGSATVEDKKVVRQTLPLATSLMRAASDLRYDAH